MSDEKGRRPESSGHQSRVFTDSEGVQWEVTEIPGRTVPAARGEKCLIFSSPVAIRRVWTYPESWVRMTADELLDLSWRR